MRTGAGLLVGATLLLLWIAAARLGATLRPRKRGALLLAGLYLVTLALCALGLSVGDALHDRIRQLGPEVCSLLVPAAFGAALASMLLSPAAGRAARGRGRRRRRAPRRPVRPLRPRGDARIRSRRPCCSRACSDVAWCGARACSSGLLQALVVAAGWLFADGRAPAALATSMAAAFLSGALLLPLAVLSIRPAPRVGPRPRERPAPARPRQPEPPGAEGAHRPGAGNLAPLGGHRRPGRGSGPRSRRGPAACPRRRLLPRPRQGQGPELVLGELARTRTGTPTFRRPTVRCS